MRTVYSKLEEEIYKCEITGYFEPVQRRSGQKREKNHKKWLYCLGCNKKHNLIKQ